MIYIPHSGRNLLRIRITDGELSAGFSLLIHSVSSDSYMPLRSVRGFYVHFVFVLLYICGGTNTR